MSILVSYALLGIVVMVLVFGGYVVPHSKVARLRHQVERTAVRLEHQDAALVRLQDEYRRIAQMNDTLTEDPAPRGERLATVHRLVRPEPPTTPVDPVPGEWMLYQPGSQYREPLPTPADHMQAEIAARFLDPHAKPIILPDGVSYQPIPHEHEWETVRAYGGVPIRTFCIYCACTRSD